MRWQRAMLNPNKTAMNTLITGDTGLLDGALATVMAPQQTAA